jgi:hypothetical protein
MKCQPLKHGLRDTGKNLAIRNEISGTWSIFEVTILLKRNI